ncbi:MAG: hypothetical protein V1854_04945 [Methanobacteriota archaeon]
MVVKVAGWRCSDYGYQGNGHGQTDPPYFVCVAQSQADKFQGSKPGGIYILGYIETTDCVLPFANPGWSIANVTYDPSMTNPDTMLSAFDAANMDVILQVEPGNADMPTLSGLIMNKFKSHPCVKGFGIDVEWYRNGIAIPSSVVNGMLTAIHAVNPAYKLVIKHFDASFLPVGVAGVTYLMDSCGMGSFSSAVSEYVAWANHFSGSELGYQMLYLGIDNNTGAECSSGVNCDCAPNDRAWWGTMINPEVQLINGVYAAIPSANIYCAYIVDFSLGYTYPTCCPALICSVQVSP